jgi:hypothetical protein
MRERAERYFIRDGTPPGGPTNIMFLFLRLNAFESCLLIVKSIPRVPASFLAHIGRDGSYFCPTSFPLSLPPPLSPSAKSEALHISVHHKICIFWGDTHLNRSSVPPPIPCRRECLPLPAPPLSPCHGETNGRECIFSPFPSR